MPEEVEIKPRAEASAPTTPTETATASAPVAEKPKPELDLTPYLVLCAGALCASFFMPWITLLLGHPSGFDLQKLGDLHKLYWAIPLFSGVAIFAALTKKSQRTAAQIAGAVPYAILLYWMAKFESDYAKLLQNLDYGAYVALISGAALEFVGKRVK